MSRIFYYINSINIVFHLETGGVSKSYINGNVQFKGALHFKNKYTHNFWTEIRGGKRIDTFEVFKSRYTYLDV